MTTTNDGGDPRSVFWDGKIRGWETSRYSALARLNPFSWTVRRRMSIAQRLVRIDFAGCRDILDLGCGSGFLAHAVVDHPERRYTGIDFSAVAVETARARFARHAERIRFEREDAIASAGREASLVVALGLLDWLDEGEIDRWFRRLKARALCFSFTESRSGGGGILYGQYRRLRDRTYRARNFSESRIVAAVRDGGYRVDRIIRTARFDPGRLVVAERA